MSFDLSTLRVEQHGHVILLGGFAITALWDEGTDELSWRTSLCDWIDAQRRRWKAHLRWSFNAQRGRWGQAARVPMLSDWVLRLPVDQGFEAYYHSGVQPRDAAAWSLSVLVEYGWQGGAGVLRIGAPAGWPREEGADAVAELAIGLWERVKPTHGWASYTVHQPPEGGFWPAQAAAPVVESHAGLQLDEPVSLLAMRRYYEVMGGSWLTYVRSDLAAQCPELASPGLDVTVGAHGTVVRAGSEPQVDVMPGTPERGVLMEAARRLAPIRLVEDPGWHRDDGRLGGERMVRWLRRFDSV